MAVCLQEALPPGANACAVLRHGLSDSLQPTVWISTEQPVTNFRTADDSLLRKDRKHPADRLHTLGKAS